MEMLPWVPFIIIGFGLAIIAFIVYSIISNRRERIEEEKAEKELTPEERVEREKRVQGYIKDSAVNEARIRGRRGVGIY